MSMVTRVAMTIARAQAKGFNGPETLARLAMAAMRELTPEMTAALGRNFAGESERHLKIGLGIESWHAMIDAALADAGVTAPSRTAGADDALNQS